MQRPRIYTQNDVKMARIASSMTQTKAAMELHIGLRTLQYYEEPGATVPRDVRRDMAELYDAPLLAIDPTSPGLAAMRFLKELDDVLDHRRRMQEITCDDEVSDDEMADWDKICREIGELCVACTVIGATQKGV